jgi:hypothetical protein
MSVEYSKIMLKLKHIFQSWNPSFFSKITGNILVKFKLFIKSNQGNIT